MTDWRWCFACGHYFSLHRSDAPGTLHQHFVGDCNSPGCDCRRFVEPPND